MRLQDICVLLFCAALVHGSQQDSQENTLVDVDVQGHENASGRKVRQFGRSFGGFGRPGFGGGFGRPGFGGGFGRPGFGGGLGGRPGGFGGYPGYGGFGGPGFGGPGFGSGGFGYPGYGGGFFG